MNTEQQFDRFKDLDWFSNDNESVVVGGAGGISSWTTLFLTRAGFNPIVYDFDRIEPHNLGGQLYRGLDINKFKTEALSNIIEEFAGTTISTFNTEFNHNAMTHTFMISGFDNMKARKHMFEVWQKSIPNSMVTPLFIDGRLEAESFQIFCVKPHNIEQYKQHLFSDDEVEDAPCTRKQTSHTASMIASHIVAFFTNHISNIKNREFIREVPFYYEYNIPMNLTETL